MKSILDRLIQHETLSRQEADGLLTAISDGTYNPSQIAAFLTVMMMRPVTIDELTGFRDALLRLCIRVDLSAYDTIDLCGTGGDGKDTFNISTLASLVVAGAGVKVAKHGNYGVSSISGSSNVMEALGVRFSNEPDFLKKCLEQANLCILHAPLFHPAMKNVAPVRRELGVKTFFNLLGPLVNPSFPQHQLSGVPNLEVARMYAYLLQQTEVDFQVVHALDGYDELSLTGKAKLISNASERLLSPQDFGCDTIDAACISGGKTVDDAAAIFMDILNGEGSKPQKDVVCANAALAISMMRKCSIEEAFASAQQSLDSKKALLSLKTLQRISR